MKKLIGFLLAGLLLAGCGNHTVVEVTTASEEVPGGMMAPEGSGVPYESRFDSRTQILLSEDGITVDGGAETENVYISRDIVYYEDRDSYDSGNPYGEGTDSDKHTVEEAERHLVVNITAPGAYEVTGKLSAGQIRVDLGENAYEDPEAVVELILTNADISCSVAPAILFLNTYECDGNWAADTAKAEIDTSDAGANLILEGENRVRGSYVAKIYKDKEGEKKLWKQDGAIYSYMSMNMFGPGSLDLRAENEGLDTELHLTINGGDLAIRAQNDGINTNEDGVSVTTINGGTVRILAGLGEEGDGIDSNGYLVINGGTVIASANPDADAGLDSDMGSYVNGGTVIALGSTMDWAESESGQVTMNLQFQSYQPGNSTILVAEEDGTEVFFFDPAEDPVLGENSRQFQGAVISCPGFQKGAGYSVWVNGQQMGYSGTDVGPGGGMRPGGKWENGAPPAGVAGEKPEMPEGQMPGGFQPGQMPEGFEGEPPELPEGEMMPQGGFGGGKPDGEKIGEFTPPEGNFGGMEFDGEGQNLFYMQDMVNAFSGVAEMEE